MPPGYIALLHDGRLAERVAILKDIYRECRLCPHECGVDRTGSRRGICRSGAHAVVASHNAHHGEEPPISGTGGSGTIFLTGCTGKCLFCQNYPISQLGTGKEVTDRELAGMMLSLQRRGCHNINVVTPTHFAPSIANAVLLAAEQGLDIPLVYNTSGYERVEILRLLEGIVDIYLPDAKYADNDIAADLSGFHDYMEHNRPALKEMHRQVGALKCSNGIAMKGMIVRHLILPGGLSGSEAVFRFLASEISRDVHVSVMDQYFPAHRALGDTRLARGITREEYDEALTAFDTCGLYNGWIQDHNEE